MRSGLELPAHVDAGLPPGLVILLTHGTDPPAFGDPVGLGPRAQALLLAACRGGAVVAHLGCNGAGMIAGGRFGDLPDRLGLGDCPRLAADGFSAFGQRCLAEGATAVLAHVDSTWSNAFADPRPLLDWADWLCFGTGAAAWAADGLFAQANRLGAEAYEHLADGNELSAGLAWMRHLDLRGFVTLGDSSARCRWSP